MHRIEVLSDKGPSSCYLINRLLASNILVGVVFEKRPLKSLLTILKARIRRISLFGVFNQILLAFPTRLIEKPKDIRSINKIYYD